jgi:hypothetical protein
MSDPSVLLLVPLAISLLVNAVCVLQVELQRRQHLQEKARLAAANLELAHEARVLRAAMRLFRERGLWTPLASRAQGPSREIQPPVVDDEDVL